MTPHPDPQVVRALWDATRSMTPGDREAYLNMHCPDSGLRQRVNDLIAADAALPATSSAESPAVAVSTRSHEDAEDGRAEPVPSRIGAYRVIRLLGEGTYGQVFL